MSKGALIVSGGLVVQQLFNFLLAIILARHLGAVGYGTFSLARNILLIVATAVPCGLDLMLLRQLPAFEGEARSLRLFFQMSRFVVFLLALTAVTMSWLFAPILGRAYFSYQSAGFQIAIMMLALPAIADLAIWGAYYRVMNAQARFSVVSLYIQSVARLALCTVALALGAGLTGVVLSSVITSTALVPLIWLDSRRLGGTPVYAVRPSLTSGLISVLRLLPSSLWMAGSLLISAILRLADVLVLGVFTSPTEVAGYAVVATVSFVVGVYPVATSQTLGPQIARHHHAGELAELRCSLEAYFRTASLASAFFAGGICAFGPMLGLLFGAAIEINQIVCGLLPVGYYLAGVFSPVGYALTMTGHQRIEFYLLSGASLVLIGGGAVLCWLFGAIGVAVAFVCAMACLSLGRVLLVRRLFGHVTVGVDVLGVPVIAIALAIAAREAMASLTSSALSVFVCGPVLYAAAYVVLLTVQIGAVGRKRWLRKLKRMIEDPDG